MDLNWWLSEIRLFVVQDTLMFAWICFVMGVMVHWLVDSLQD